MVRAGPLVLRLAVTTFPILVLFVVVGDLVVVGAAAEDVFIDVDVPVRLAVTPLCSAFCQMSTQGTPWIGKRNMGIDKCKRGEALARMEYTKTYGYSSLHRGSNFRDGPWCTLSSPFAQSVRG